MRKDHANVVKKTLKMNVNKWRVIGIQKKNSGYILFSL